MNVDPTADSATTAAAAAVPAMRSAVLRCRHGGSRHLTRAAGTASVATACAAASAVASSSPASPSSRNSRGTVRTSSKPADFSAATIASAWTPTSSLQIRPMAPMSSPLDAAIPRAPRAAAAQRSASTSSASTSKASSSRTAASVSGYPARSSIRTQPTPADVADNPNTVFTRMAPIQSQCRRDRRRAYFGRCRTASRDRPPIAQRSRQNTALPHLSTSTPSALPAR
ncbi:hypothetical protein DIQ79_30340 [Mycolicibacterium smegmatis]|uniref:Uncharacterized protein n=1 Tax=Mycolicibacterium smegmatis (strain ATCC 700084 / mc(2)155) TaxID=246196 RepID=A0QYL6_MYCS2|nr:hypothetical protein MSMEG_3703 [Mycolicibacterium smegmatis MC2 155]TBM39969.1 hypothetical protein DIQ86_27060 [Mycolicibacterium smegmatis]TBH28127.1 hypothetical protein EYS45_29735 [Mycolicibacterium smegmatis MC2 155]TBM44946.1 hypothetical protein DIQ85_30565 [Mycolicibacterium smegmatis]TBM54916.1 hypothetical protein DIQ83_30315 [Mycolicibacterium smegmatis]